MDSLRKEIEEELKRTRIDKSRIYDAILKLLDAVENGSTGSGSQGERGPPGPAGPAGPPGPIGPAGPACDCKSAPTATVEKKAAPKKTTASKKKTLPGV